MYYYMCRAPGRPARRACRAYYRPFRPAIGHFNSTTFGILHGPAPPCTALHRPALVDTLRLRKKASNWPPLPAWPARRLGKPCLPYNLKYLKIHDITYIKHILYILILLWVRQNRTPRCITQTTYMVQEATMGPSDDTEGTRQLFRS